jgi:hypothetical protein
VGRADNAIGPPDGRDVVIGAVKVSRFRGHFHGDLLALLTTAEFAHPVPVDAGLLANGDVIGFELQNVGARPSADWSGGWESSLWLFDDGSRSVTVDWDAAASTPVPPEVKATGSIRMSAYSTFFGFPMPGKNVLVSYILFELPESLDLKSSRFSIKVSHIRHRPTDEATADADAIGLLACVS